MVNAAIACFFVAFACASYLIIEIVGEMVAERRAACAAAARTVVLPHRYMVETRGDAEARRAIDEARRALADAIELAKRASERLVPITGRPGLAY